MMENFQNNPPHQELLVEKIGRIKKNKDGKYVQKQTIDKYERFPKTINYNNLGPDIYAVYVSNDDCNKNRYILYYNDKTNEFFYFDQETGKIVGYDSEHEAKERKEAEERANEKEYIDISNVDLKNVDDVKNKIMDELSYDKELKELHNSPLEKLKRAFIEADNDGLNENIISDMKNKLDKNKLHHDTKHHSYFNKDEIKRLNELSNSELTDEQLKLDCPKRKQKKCKNGFKIMYDLPEKYGKNCPYRVCNDVTFLEKYKKGILILIILCLLVIVILMAI